MKKIKKTATWFVRRQLITFYRRRRWQTSCDVLSIIAFLFYSNPNKSKLALYLAAKVNVESLSSLINLDICDLISKTLLASLETNNSLKSDFSYNNSEKIKSEKPKFCDKLRHCVYKSRDALHWLVLGNVYIYYIYYIISYSIYVLDCIEPKMIEKPKPEKIGLQMGWVIIIVCQCSFLVDYFLNSFDFCFVCFWFFLLKKMIKSNDKSQLGLRLNKTKNV